MKIQLNLTAAGILLAAIVACPAQTPTPDDFNPGADSGIYALAVQADGKVLVGGAFTQLGGTARSRIARVGPDGTLDTAFNPGADSTIMALAMQPGGKIVVAGWFNTLGGVARNRIGLLNAEGVVNSTFDPGANGYIYSLAMEADGRILVGGSFTTLGGQTRNRIARLNADGTLDTSFDPGADLTVRSLAVQPDAKIVVGGFFTTLGGQSRMYLARLNADGSVDSGFDPGANNSVYSLAVQADGKIVAGGDFNTVAGQPRNRIARLNSDGTLDAAFDPGADGSVYSLAVQADGKIVAGGEFTTVAGQTRSRIARLNSDGTLDTAFDPGANGSVYSLAVQPDGKVLAGGGFSTLGGQARNRIGRLNSTDPATESLTGDGATVTWLRDGSGPEVWRTTFDYSTNATDWLSLGAGTRVTGGWQLTNPVLLTNGILRARGFVAGGYDNASSWFIQLINSCGAGAPSFLMQPTSRTKDAGTTAIFNVAAGGAPPLSYQWRKDELALADGANTAGATTSLLTLSNVFGGDAGGYSVVVTNALGSVTSQVATLTVIDPVIVTQPQSLTNLAGTTATFTVAATGTEPLAYQWQQLNGNWSDLADCTNTALLLTNVQRSQAGDYRVVVTDVYGAATSDVAHLTVLGPMLQLAASAYSVAENAGTVSLTVRRLSDTNAAVTVDYATANGTATAGSDYTATNGTLTFLAGETNQTITVPILNDGLVESTETFTVTLSNPTGEGAVLGTPATATVSITENDAGGLQFEFGSATFGSYRVGENEGFILLGVVRGDDGDLPVTVDFATSNGSGIGGLDYVATNGTLSFAAGQRGAVFTVPILNDGLKESSETFSVTLSNPTNQVLGSQKTATVTILDNDSGIQFQPAYLSRVAENEGARALTVVRGNDVNLGPITVNYATANLTATAGLDYVATNGTLSFAEGEMVKTITLRVLYDALPEPDEQFQVTLSNPTGGAVLGPYATTAIVILDITNTPPHRFEALTVQPDRNVQLALGGSVDGHFKDYFDLYPIEVSSNLVDWTPLVTLLRTNTATNALTYTDTQATNWDHRFYRTATNHLITPSVKPTGPFPAGMVSRLLTDPSRRNRYWLSTNCSFMISVWYPAVAEAGRLPGRLVDLQLAEDPTWMAIYGASDFTARMPYLMAHTLRNALCATNQAPYPIVLYSPGFTAGGNCIQELGLNLASHGYVAVSVDHYDVCRTVFPDGTYLQGDMTLSVAGFQDRVKDLGFILDELTRWNTNDPVFAGRLDLTKVAAIGGSWGADTIADFGRNDARCKAFVGLDGGIGVATPRLEQPVLQIEASISPDTSFYDATTNHGVCFQITSTDHIMIVGVDWYWAWHPENVAGGREVERTVNAYTVWFLNKYLKGSSDPMPALAEYPRVTGFQQK